MAWCWHFVVDTWRELGPLQLPFLALLCALYIGSYTIRNYRKSHGPAKIDISGERSILHSSLNEYYEPPYHRSPHRLEVSYFFDCAARMKEASLERATAKILGKDLLPIAQDGQMTPISPIPIAKEQHKTIQLGFLFDDAEVAKQLLNDIRENRDIALDITLEFDSYGKRVVKRRHLPLKINFTFGVKEGQLVGGQKVPDFYKDGA